ncbi:PREDICTED: nuclear pore membrane glycoprotein 210-like [Amphimedon queenslandica]|uniref:NUP210 Ig-like domain-containing protein n=1 Tax=Amphimedon queenslandica TaxID=400682 RepID=A0AAN0JXI3_AMPQE|nr:PREDICTED: nuclear pore membrane glycoprotein 210-like [Amphimedon queenslandica]|eukprot:XP_019861906.1 PREDICTED: nuclear pore membrane glycoprotein 210-like [Amphimedon queenslandica]
MTDCPLLREGNLDTQFPVLNNQLLVLEVIVYDKERHRFDNFSSLHWKWSSSDSSLLPLNPPNSQWRHYGNRAVLSTGLSRTTGSVSVTLSSNTHQIEVLEAAGTSFQDPYSPTVESSLSLLLKYRAVLDPESALVYNHPNNRFIVSILHGSSFFYVDHVIKPRPPVADVEYIKDSHQINILPVGEGHVLISVKDLCLPGDLLSSVIHISTIHFIRVRAPDKVSTLTSCNNIIIIMWLL